VNCDFFQDGCTAREAVILGSILAKISVPMMHSGAALLKLTELPYSGPTLIFVKTLLNKKYSLPYQVIEALVKYFVRFEKDERQMPVIWHQTFLVFAQR
jgi:essential nuclear protein 1